LQLQITEQKEEAEKVNNALSTAANELAIKLKDKDKKINELNRDISNASQEIQDCYNMPAPDSVVSRVYAIEAED